MRRFLALLLLPLLLPASPSRAQGVMIPKDKAATKQTQGTPRAVAADSAAVPAIEPAHAPAHAPAYDTSVTLTILGTDTTKTLTIRERDPVRSIDKTLKNMFILQVASFCLTVGAGIFMMIALN